MLVPIECICPLRDGERRHPDGDTVTLRDVLDFRTAMILKNTVVLLKAEEDVSAEEALAALTEGYLLYGIEAWSVLDDKGKPLALTKGTIRDRLLADIGQASIVADRADKLYHEHVMLPLLVPALTPSPPTPTEPSTSATNGHSPMPPKRSKRSSTTTSPTAGIAPTTVSPAGVSSSSPS